MTSMSPQPASHNQFISSFSVENIISKKAKNDPKGEENSLNHSGSSSSATSCFGKN